MVRPDWDSYFMLIAKLVSVRSTCLSRPTGAVIVKDNQIIAAGYNGALPGQPHCIDKDECLSRTMQTEVKYQLCRSCHAEANAIALAAKHGTAVNGATLYCTLQPCLTCTKTIVQAGISRVVYELEYASKDPVSDEFWKKTLLESGIVSEQFALQPNAQTAAVLALSNITSERRL